MMIVIKVPPQKRKVIHKKYFSNNCFSVMSAWFRLCNYPQVPDGQLLSINSVFGGAKATQEADNVLILQVKSSSALNQSKKALQVK